MVRCKTDREGQLSLVGSFNPTGQSPELRVRVQQSLGCECGGPPNPAFFCIYLSIYLSTAARALAATNLAFATTTLALATVKLAFATATRHAVLCVGALDVSKWPRAPTLGQNSCR